MTSTSMHDWTFWCTASLGIIGPDQRGWDENVTEVSCGPEEGRRAASVENGKEHYCRLRRGRAAFARQPAIMARHGVRNPFLRRGFFAVAGKKKGPGIEPGLRLIAIIAC